MAVRLNPAAAVRQALREVMAGKMYPIETLWAELEYVAPRFHKRRRKLRRVVWVDEVIYLKPGQSKHDWLDEKRRKELGWDRWD